MNYLFVVKKSKGTKGDAPILKLLHAYCKKYGDDDFVVCLPGYLSRTQTAIDNFSNKFPSKSKSRHGYFFKGMNGGSALKVGKVKSTITIQEYINDLYGKHDSSIPSPQDHSEVAIFFSKEEYNKYVLNSPSKNNIDNLINHGKVKAILLGSSNQSHNSYILSPAPKGEADIFIVHSEVFGDCESSSENNIVSFYSDFSHSLGESDPSLISLSKEITATISLEEMVMELFKQ